MNWMNGKPSSDTGLVANIPSTPHVHLSPMSGVTDLPFRLLALELGADLTVTEFTSAEALSRDQPRSWERVRTDPRERPFVVQIFGGDRTAMVTSAQRLAETADIIDINFGCPAPKVARASAGAALMADPDRLVDLVAAVIDAVEIPVTVKLRLGIDEAHRNIVEISERLEQVGSLRLCVHGRTLKQRYRGHADWSVIASVVKAVSIPVIANGDVVDGASARACLDATGAGGVMIGRAALGAPHVLWHVKTGLGWSGGTPPWSHLVREVPASQTSVEEDRAAKSWGFSRYVELSEETDSLRVKWLRRHAVDFTRGLPGGKSVRQALHRVGDDCEAMIRIVQDHLSLPLSEARA